MIQTVHEIFNECKELPRYKSVLKSLVLRNLYGRYKSTHLGFLWHFITPLVLLFTYYIAFTEILAGSIDDYWLYLASGMFTFSFLVGTLTSGSGCIISQGSIIKKMYIPKTIIVLAYVISSFIIVLIEYVIILILMLIFGCIRNPIILMLLPLAFLLIFVFSLGCALLLSSLTVYIKDIQYIFSSLSIVFFFLTPMFFISSEATGIMGKIVWYNPLTYYVDLFHDILYWQSLSGITNMIFCIIIDIILLIAGTIVFNKLKKGFPERI